MALQFSTLLEQAGIPLKDTWLLRHQDKRGGKGKTPYDLWREQKGELERYQSIQSSDICKPGQWLASFVGTPFNETLFTGLFHVKGVGTVPPGVVDPVTGSDVEGLFLYDIEPVDALQEYAGKLVIDWGLGSRAWKQRATNPNKPVLEIRASVFDPPFPGFLNFRHAIRQLDTVPTNWGATLAAVRGIYALVSESTGKIYVGAAYGERGFWGRWESYFRNGHGGNEGLKLLPGHQYQVAILEVASSSAGLDDIREMEKAWKRNLLTLSFGLNRNL